MDRRTFISALAGLALAAGSGIALAQQASPQAAVDAYLAAWNAHDIDKAAAIFAENVVYYDAAVGTPATGTAAARGVVENFVKGAPDLVWKIKGAPVVQDNRVAFEWEFSGTNTGDWADGTKATGKKFHFTGASVFTVKDGKIESQSDYYDALGFYKQLGLL